jgi:hypothetical protein
MRTYEVNPQPQELGGGWSLKLFEDGEEMGGGVFPPVLNTEEPDFDEAYQNALDEGGNWIASRACTEAAPAVSAERPDTVSPEEPKQVCGWMLMQAGVITTLEEPAFLDDDGPSVEIPPFITTTNARELYGIRPGETIQQAMARRDAERKRKGN